MLDIKYIRENVDLLRKTVTDKRIGDCDLDRLLAVDARRRELIPVADRLRADVARLSRDAHRAEGDEQEQLRSQAASCKAELKGVEEELRDVDGEFARLMLFVPQPTAADVPVGADDSENAPLREVGTVPPAASTPLDHIEIGLRLGLFDFERGVKTAGTRNYYLTGDGCLLEWAVLRLSLEHMVEKGFTPMTVPLLVRDHAMEGTAYYPGGEEQAYRMERDSLSLVGTAEVSLMAFHHDEILAVDDLPLRYVALSNCFRREAGAAGRDTRGLYRIHQFQKVEQVVLCEADEAEQVRLHQEILQNSEEVLAKLELPYRVVNVCTGDLGRGQQKKFDIECWMPSREGWGETHSASRFGDFQTRRLKIRYKPKGGGKATFAYSLNNTVIASPRILIPLLEIHQQPDGSVRIPEALRPHLGGRERLEPK